MKKNCARRSRCLTRMETDSSQLLRYALQARGSGQCRDVVDIPTVSRTPVHLRHCRYRCFLNFDFFIQCAYLYDSPSALLCRYMLCSNYSPCKPICCSCGMS